MKRDWPVFATMRRLVMRFRGMLKSKSVGKLGAWLRDAQKSACKRSNERCTVERGQNSSVRTCFLFSGRCNRK
jgi:hypothetical protein